MMILLPGQLLINTDMITKGIPMRRDNETNTGRKPTTYRLYFPGDSETGDYVDLTAEQQAAFFRLAVYASEKGDA